MRKIVLFIIFNLIVLSVEGQTSLFRKDVSQASWHRKIQNEVSYETWLKNQPKIRVKEAKSAVDQSKQINSNKSKNKKLNNKITRIRKRIKK